MKADIFKRSWFLYVAVFIILWVSIDQDRVHMKTMDYLKNIPVQVIEFAQHPTQLNRPFWLPQAIRYYESMAKMFPELSEAQSTLAFCYYHDGRYSLAKKYYQKAIKLNPDVFGLYYDLGLVSFISGDYQLAQKSFNQALRVSPKETVMYAEMIIPAKPQDVEQMNDRIDAIKHFYEVSVKWNQICNQFSQLSPEQKVTAQLAIKSWSKALFVYPPILDKDAMIDLMKNT